jgi:hypothetical protein
VTSRVGAAAAAVLFSLAGLAAAQPDPRQMSGIPLPDAGLSDGTISVRVIRGQLANNVADHAVELRQGDIVETATTDAEGRAVFLTLNPGQQVRAATELDGVRIESRPFAVPGRGGVRLMLVGANPDVAAEPAPPGLVTFGGESFIQVELVEESIEVYYVFDLLNPAQVPVEPPAPIVVDLPSGAQGVTVLPGSSPRTVADGPQVELPGPFDPGSTPLRIAYILPYSGASLALSQSFPLDWDSVLLSVEKSGDVDFVSSQVPRRAEVPSETRAGTGHLIGAGPRVAAGTPFSFELTGLPYRSTLPSTVTLVVALAILGFGCWGAVGSAGAAAPAGTRDELQARRERLFVDLVRIERQHRAGKIGPTRYATRRGDLFEALEKVYRALEEETAHVPPAPVPSAPGAAPGTR